MANQTAGLAKCRRKRLPGKYYPLKLAFSYWAYRRGHLIQRGFGETVEISSGGVRLKPSEIVCLGATDIEMSIAWPARLRDGTELQFFVQGKPFWDGLGLAEILILKHEFRTAARTTHGLSVRSGYSVSEGSGARPQFNPAIRGLTPVPVRPGIALGLNRRTA